MDASTFDTLTRRLRLAGSRRGAIGCLLIGAISLLGSQTDEAGAKKKKPCPPCKKRKKGKCKATLPDGTVCENGGQCQSGRCLSTTSPPPPPGAAVVASYCAGSGGSSRALALGQPFIALRGGRLDRAEVTALDGPSGQFAIEIRDLNQGKGISTAPVLATATVTVPEVAQGSSHVVTAQFSLDAPLIADDQYALVVRFLGAGDSQHYFRQTPAANCAGPGILLSIPNGQNGQTTFTPLPGERKLEHTVYVVP